MTEEERKAQAINDAMEAKERDKARAEADAARDAKLDKLLTHVDTMGKAVDAVTHRLDALERAKPDGEAAEAEKARKAEEERRARLTTAEREAEDAAGEDEDEAEVQDTRTEDEIARGVPRKTAADAATRMRRHDDAMAKAQGRADSVASIFGERAPPPMSGEGIRAYRRRLLSRFQHHSPEFKGVDLRGIRDARAFAGVEARILADASAAGATPATPEDGTLREVVRVDAVTGQRSSTFFGKRSFVCDLKRPPAYVTKFFTPSRADARE